jgi:hypothetical protein
MLLYLIVGITIAYIVVVVYLNLKSEMKELWDWEK